MNNETWVEVALNGPWARSSQPNIPISADEIVEEAISCAKEGASVIHFHAYDPITGRQRDDYEIYAPIMNRIRSKVDVICYPTIPFAGNQDSPNSLSPSQRYAAVKKLGEAGLLEWAVIDPGSVNIALLNALLDGEEGFIYSNPVDHIRYGYSLAQQYQMNPSYAIYEPGFLRLGATLHRCYIDVPPAIYRFMFTNAFSFGFPPKAWALEAYLNLLHTEAPNSQWMVAGLGVEIEPLIPIIIEKRGHIRIGLEDRPLHCTSNNIELTKNAVRIICTSGGSIASPTEVRSKLKGKPAQS